MANKELVENIQTAKAKLLSTSRDGLEKTKKSVEVNALGRRKNPRFSSPPPYLVGLAVRRAP